MDYVVPVFQRSEIDWAGNILSEATLLTGIEVREQEVEENGRPTA